MTVLRDLSLILLAAEAFVLALVPVALLGGLVYGLWWLLRHENLPAWVRLAQAYLALGSAYVELAMRVVMRPFLLVHSALAAVRDWLGAIAKLAKGR
jgi:hypothetical protein